MDKAKRLIEVAEKSMPDTGVKVEEPLAAFIAEILGIDVETVKKRLSNANVYSLDSFIKGVKK